MAPSKLHGITWAPDKKFAVVVTYSVLDIDHMKMWAESWPVAAFNAKGEPLVMDGNLITVSELLKRYTDEDPGAKWALESAVDWPYGVRAL